MDGRWIEPTGIADETIGQDSYAIPGLIDAHAHLAAPIGQDWKTDTYENAVSRALQAVTNGVMFIFDKGWSNLDTVRILEEVSPEQRPDIQAAGIINAVEEGYWPDFAHELTEATFESGIRRSIEEGRGWVKLVGDWPRRGRGPVANFDEDQLRRAVELAEAAGSRVAIHTMAREAPSMAVRAGVHSIEHGLFLDTDDLEALGSRSGMWVPTILRMEAVVEQLGAESSGGKLLVEGLDNVRRQMELAVEAGVHVLAGTDVTVGTHDVALEAEKMIEYGLPIELAYRSVTSAGYLAGGRSDGFEVGEPANVVLLRTSPLEDFTTLAHPERVIRMGRVLR